MRQQTATLSPEEELHLIVKNDKEGLAFINQVEKQWNGIELNGSQETRLKSWLKEARYFVERSMMGHAGYWYKDDDFENYLCVKKDYDRLLHHLKEISEHSGLHKLYATPTELPCIVSSVKYTNVDGAETYSLILVEYELLRLKQTILGNSFTPLQENARAHIETCHQAEFVELTHFVNGVRSVFEAHWEDKPAGKARLEGQKNVIEKLFRLAVNCQGPTMRGGGPKETPKQRFIAYLREYSSVENWIKSLSNPLLNHHSASTSHSLNHHGFISRKLAIYNAAS